MYPLETIADRAWYAWHCLPRRRGSPPPLRALEEKNGLYNGLFRKIFEGRNIRASTLSAVASVLNVSSEWLLHNRGPAPTLTGSISSRETEFGPVSGQLATLCNQTTSWDNQEIDERYPTRAAVVAMIKAAGSTNQVEQMALEGMQSLRLSSKDDPGESFWMQKFREYQALAQQIVTEKESGSYDDDFERSVLDPDTRCE